MRFGEIPSAEAEGAILAHGVKLGDARFRKGRVLSADDVAALIAAGIAQVMVARRDPDDVDEDAAAARVARAAAGFDASDPPASEMVELTAAFTGRANLYAKRHGVALVDAARVDAANAVDESVTLATLAPFAVVRPRQMLATAKIIPFAAPAQAVAAAVAALTGPTPAVTAAPFRDKRIGLVSTRTPGMKESLLQKNRAALEQRLAALGAGRVVAEARADHAIAAVAEALRAMLATETIDIALVFGATAITDRRDVIPAAIVAAGGAVDHFGMPVDPGNLLLLGRIGAIPAVGLPSCARSPKLNGFDFVLQRLLADLPVGRGELMGMGAGGLLTEIASRPQRRDAPGRADKAADEDEDEDEDDGPPAAPRIAAVLLAAGRAARMGDGENKLTRDVGGAPMVRRAAAALIASQADPVIVVTGAARDGVRAALDGLDVRFVHNADFADGMAGSIATGLAAVPADADGAMIALGDMPGVRAETVDRLIAAFNPVEGRAIVAPMVEGGRGHPVIWARRFFPAMARLRGDAGAKSLLKAHADEVIEVACDDQGCLVDLDTPEALTAYRAAMERGGGA